MIVKDIISVTVKNGPDESATFERLVKDTLLEVKVAALFTRYYDHAIFDACRSSVVHVNIRLLFFIDEGFHSFFKDIEDIPFQLVLACWIVYHYRFD